MLQAYRAHVGENLLLAMDTLRTHKFRSFLTVLGVVIGTTTVIAVTSIIAGLDKQLVDVAEQFGTRTLWVYKLQMGAPHAMTREERLRRPLSYEDAMAIKDQAPSASTVSVELFREIGDFGLPPVTARYKGQDMNDALFVGVTSDHLRLLNTTLDQGRFFTEVEDVHRRDVAVIGNGVRERFFKNADPLGKSILVDGHTLEIVGTLAKFKSFLGDDQNDKAILDRKSTRLNSSHLGISYAVFCLKKTITFFPHLIRGAEAAARRRGYFRIAVNSDDDGERQKFFF